MYVEKIGDKNIFLKIFNSQIFIEILLKWFQDKIRNKDIWTSDQKEIPVHYVMLLFMFDLIYF